MLAGTLRGASNVPQDWTSLFQPQLIEKIRSTADRMADLIATDRLAALKTRKSIASQTPAR